MKGARPLSDEEIEVIKKNFIEQDKLRDLALFLFMLKTGVRISEALSIRIGSVVNRGKVVDKVSIKKSYTKGKVETKTIFLHPEAKQALLNWLRFLPSEDPGLFIFRSRKGGNRPISRVQAWRILNEQFEKHEMVGQLGCHCTRKTFAKKMYKALDNDIVKLQKALHHSSIITSVAYLSFMEEDIDEAIMKI